MCVGTAGSRHAPCAFQVRLGVRVPEVRDGGPVQVPERVGREGIKLDLHQPAVPSDEVARPRVAGLAHLRRQVVALDLIGRQRHPNNLVEHADALDEVPRYPIRLCSRQVSESLATDVKTSDG
jgi:hypothetical protein